MIMPGKGGGGGGGKALPGFPPGEGGGGGGVEALRGFHAGRFEGRDISPEAYAFAQEYGQEDSSLGEGAFGESRRHRQLHREQAGAPAGTLTFIPGCLGIGAPEVVRADADA